MCGAVSGAGKFCGGKAGHGQGWRIRAVLQAFEKTRGLLARRLAGWRERARETAVTRCGERSVVLVRRYLVRISLLSRVTRRV
jgi:hypothetical protein